MEMEQRRKDNLTTPVLAHLLKSRKFGLAVIGAGGLQGGSMACGLPDWPCAFWSGLGCPCPGCGLARAIAALLRGEWQSALAFHAFSPLVVQTSFSYYQVQVLTQMLSMQ